MMATAARARDLLSHGTVEEEGQHRSIFIKTKQPITLKFEQVMYKIRTGNDKKQHQGSDGGGGSERTILKGVSGVVLPGDAGNAWAIRQWQDHALSALGGRLSNKRFLNGGITYNGRSLSSSLKRNMGFVTQDDILYPHLTVAETLLYTALLRLPGNLSRQEKAEHVEAVMQQLGLTVCCNCIIGGGLVRGVSGGERKRVSIGQEILVNPSLLFLDEPTSGLDSTTAQCIVSLLLSMTSEGGRTIVMTIHQPSSRLFYMFHKVLLLSDGYPLYSGKGSEAMAYFASIGFAPSVPMNPADFLLDLANGVSSDDAQENRSGVKEALVSSYKSDLHAQQYYNQAVLSAEQIVAEGADAGLWLQRHQRRSAVVADDDIKETGRLLADASSGGSRRWRRRCSGGSDGGVDVVVADGGDGVDVVISLLLVSAIFSLRSFRLLPFLSPPLVLITSPVKIPERS
ncbi:hypothetical protein J5N97_011967 [Dioscorea zingiberensis]|uniref:ABC transporter domain-containing protein n=1 Tax=Dioscorea zingiberensis TaxID=325984 RepID=A0A9D5D3P3_9LILI|nr:hypothetical protein J5N97_011967 [Dioscorea zingiberensis]